MMQLFRVTVGVFQMKAIDDGRSTMVVSVIYNISCEKMLGGAIKRSTVIQYKIMNEAKRVGSVPHTGEWDIMTLCIAKSRRGGRLLVAFPAFDECVEQEWKIWMEDLVGSSRREGQEPGGWTGKGYNDLPFSATLRSSSVSGTSVRSTLPMM
jgi:hypothetical protein